MIPFARQAGRPQGRRRDARLLQRPRRRSVESGETVTARAATREGTGAPSAAGSRSVTPTAIAMEPIIRVVCSQIAAAVRITADDGTVEYVGTNVRFRRAGFLWSFDAEVGRARIWSHPTIVAACEDRDRRLR